MTTSSARVRVLREPEEQFFDNWANYKDASDLRFDRLVSPKKAAELLDVSVKFIYESIARREIEAIHVGGRLRRIRLSVLEAWLHREKRR